MRKTVREQPIVCNLCDFILYSMEDLTATCSIEGKLILSGNLIKGVISIPKWCPLDYHLPSHRSPAK